MAWMRMIGANSVQYHRDTVLDREDDHPGAALAYYASRGETPLEWGGGGAAPLGLVGQVSSEHYEAIYGPGGAQHPHTGHTLTRTRRPGLELSVSAHKSVAELGVIGRVEDMHLLQDAERDATIDYLERLTVTRGGRRGRAAVPTATSGLVYAVTRHATTRSGDPGIHDHVLLANVVEMLDARGYWKAADTALWRDRLHAATAHGRMASACLAVDLGYGIVADNGPTGRLGHWAIAGIPAEVMAVHSKRSVEIDKAVGPRKEHVSYRERAIAARKTRSAKQLEPVVDLMDRWRQELIEVGFHLDEVSDLVDQAHEQRIATELDDEAIERLAVELLSTEGRLAGWKVFARHQVVVAAAPKLFGLDPAGLDPVGGAVLAHRDAVELEPTEHARETVWAPRCVIETEEAIAARARHRHLEHTATAVSVDAVAQAIVATEHSLGVSLTESQRRTVEGICGSGRGLDVVVGLAGSGKTTALEAVRRAVATEGLHLLGTATSGQAARTVGQGAGIESSTVASLLARLDRGSARLDERTVVVLDEASMTDDQDLLRLLDETAQARAKLVLVGDDRQLSAVGPGGSLAALVARFDGEVWELDENIRQANLDERAALAELRHGDIETAVGWLASNGRIDTGANEAEAVGAMVDGWIADIEAGKETAMLAWKRSSVAALNELGRTAFEEAGRLTGPEVIASRGGRRYRVGDRVVSLQPYPGVNTSETGTVTAVDPEREWVTVRLDRGDEANFHSVFLSDRHLDHAYARTVHRTQGATVDTTHYLADGGGRELAYVALSRARERSTVYAEADDLDQAVEDLTAAWSVEQRDLWSIDRTLGRASEGPGSGVSLGF